MKTKKTIAMLLIAALSITITACSSNEVNPTELNNEIDIVESIQEVESNEPKDTPVRVGANYGSMLFNDITFEEAVEEADIIVDLTIVEWLGESVVKWVDGEVIGRHPGETFFSAKINRTLKGEEHESIVLRQSGNSEGAYNDDPLFRNGDRLLLFLHKVPEDELKICETETGLDFEKGAFHSLRAYQTPIIIWEHKNETFLLSRHDWDIAHYIAKDKNVKKADKDTLDSIVESFLDYDPIFKELDYTLGYAFNYDDVINRILEISKEVELQ